MKNAGGILILAIIAVAIGWYLRAHNLALNPEAGQKPMVFLTSPLTPGPFPSATQTPLPPLGTASATPAPTPSEAAKPTAALPLAPLNKVTPTVATLRDEVSKDPHTTPQSLLRFGLEVGERMDKALSSETEASSFLPELDTCVRNASHDVPQSAQALCLESAHDLAKKFPSLDAQVKEISLRADPAAARLAH